MKIGMLWFDNSQDSFAIKCNRAIDYYQRRYGYAPTTIYVHTATAIEEIPNVAIVTSKSILPNHFWVGKEK